eukprot:1159239-Pelagomonas_calceolata.AAC.5
MSEPSAPHLQACSHFSRGRAVAQLCHAPQHVGIVLGAVTQQALVLPAAATAAGNARALGEASEEQGQEALPCAAQGVLALASRVPGAGEGWVGVTHGPCCTSSEATGGGAQSRLDVEWWAADNGEREGGGLGCACT